jgi:glucokinase
MIVKADVTGGAPPRTERFPHPDSLEAVATGGALAVLGREHGFTDGKDVVRAAHEGDAKAVEALRVLGERLGIGMANLLHTFDPDEFVIGGGVAAGAGALLLDPAVAAAKRLTLPGVGTACRFRLARHGNAAGIRGAALLAAHELQTSHISETTSP